MNTAKIEKRAIEAVLSDDRDILVVLEIHWNYAWDINIQSTDQNSWLFALNGPDEGSVIRQGACRVRVPRWFYDPLQRALHVAQWRANHKAWLAKVGNFDLE